MNLSFAKLIVHNLISCGVRRFCLSPGSRSSPLAYAIAHEELASSFVHFDERGMAFHALGYAKASQEPVAIVCTSGSAVTNLFPALAEASHAGVPLIVLTADRPPELSDCGSNQTCDQVKIFGSYVRWEIDLPCPGGTIPESYISSSIAYAVYRATQTPKGAVHINCRFREPLFTSGTTPLCTPTHYETSHTSLPKATLERFGKYLSRAERGVIIAGSFSTTRELKGIYALAEHLHFPILPDILSGLRGSLDHSTIIPYYDAILKSHSYLKPDFILHLGDRLVSKTLLEWIKKSNSNFYTLVAAHSLRHDPNHNVTHRIECDPTLFCEQVLPFTSHRSSWISQWKELSDVIAQDLISFENTFTEFGLIRFLHHHIPSHYAFFLSNSLPIRHADQFFFPKFFKGPIFGNRGLSGIDGNIATAIGIAEGAQRPTIALLGDLAALHDLNSLAQVHKTSHPVIFLIINNSGGGIFSFVTNPTKKEIFEEFWAEKHPFNFENAAKNFQLPYHHLKDFSSLAKALKEEKSCVIEITTNREETYAMHSRILETCSKSFSCTVS